MNIESIIPSGNGGIPVKPWDLEFDPKNPASESCRAEPNRNEVKSLLSEVRATE
jgi:hypothetical protein